VTGSIILFRTGDEFQRYEIITKLDILRRCEGRTLNYQNNAFGDKEGSGVFLHNKLYIPLQSIFSIQLVIADI